MPKKSKPPARRVPSDDYTLVLDNETYYPHVGEWVEFRSRGSVADTMLAIELSQLQGSGPDELKEHLGKSGTMADITGNLANNIKAWSWTNDDGEPFPSPPTARDIRALSFEEIGYLIGAQRGDQKAPESDDDRVNASSDSTSS